MPSRWTCSPSPGTSATPRRESAPSTVAPAPRLAPCCSAPDKSAVCGPGPRTSQASSAWVRRAKLAGGRLAADGARLAVLRDTLWEQLRDAIPAMVRHTPQDCLPNTLMVSFPDVLGQHVPAEDVGEGDHEGVGQTVLRGVPHHGGDSVTQLLPEGVAQHGQPGAIGG